MSNENENQQVDYGQLLLTQIQEIEKKTGGIGEELVGALVSTKESIDKRIDVLDDKMDMVLKGSSAAVSAANATVDKFSSVSDFVNLSCEAAEESRIRLHPKTWLNMFSRVAATKDADGNWTKARRFDGARTALTVGSATAAGAGTYAAVNKFRNRGAGDDMSVMPIDDDSF